MPLQSWDIGFTDRGPVVVEVNDVSGHPCQHVGPPLMLDRRLSAFLRRRGVEWSYPYEEDEEAAVQSDLPVRVPA
jgi:hypothetical protein